MRSTPRLLRAAAEELRERFRVDLDGLFEQPVEEETPVVGAAAVEAEGELVQVVVATRFEPEAVKIEPADGDDDPKEGKMDVIVRFTLSGGGDEANTAEWIARLVAGLLREEGLAVGERGVGVRASRSRTAHADVQEDA